jgi:tetratricopeptide (TPR) repeat protein
VSFFVADFGIGGLSAGQKIQEQPSVRGSRSQYLPTAIRGAYTPLYASPQQVQGGAPDPRDDVHALGVIWYQLITGDLKLMSIPPDWQDILREAGLPAGHVELIASCITARAERRLASAADLADRLAAIAVQDAGQKVAKETSDAVTSGEQRDGSGPQKNQVARVEEEREERQSSEETADTQEDVTSESTTRLDSEKALAATQTTTTGAIPQDHLADAHAALAVNAFSKAIKACNRALKAGSPPGEACRLRAQAYVGEGKLEQALEDLNRVVATPNAASSDFVERGRLLGRIGKGNKAVGDFTQALILEPQCLAAYLARAQEYAAAGSMDLAFADFAAALRIAPQSAEVYYHRAEALRSRGDYEQALADFNEASRLQPGEARCHVGRGRAYLGLGQTQQALSEFIQATHADPRCAEAYLFRGVLHGQLGQDRQALADFDTALRLDRGLEEAYTYRAQANARLGQFARAESDYKRAIRKSPRAAMLHVERGDLRAARGNWEGALEDYARATRLEKDLARAHLQRGRAYLRTGQYAYALSSLSRALELAPADPEPRALRGLALAHKGRFDEALADAEECFRLNQHLASAHNVRGLALAERNELEPALAELSAAIRLDPDSAAFRADRGSFHYAQGNYDNAIADFKEAIKLEPKEANYYTLRAKAHDKQGDRERAQADRQKAASLASPTRRRKSKTGPQATGSELQSGGGVEEADAGSAAPCEVSRAGGEETNTGVRRKRKARAKYAATLAEVIASGLIDVPVSLFRRYKATRLEARLLANGKVEFQGIEYDTCSNAADAARGTVTGQRMNTNGWTFWRYRDGRGEIRTLDDARQHVLRMKNTPEVQ